MPELIVTVNKLNKRKALPSNFSDKDSIIGVVLKGFRFYADEVPAGNMGTGKWYKDRDGYFYWGGGVSIIMPDVPAIPVIIATGWSFEKLSIHKFWEAAGNRGNGITIAVLDTGISPIHTEFDFSRITRYNVLDGSGNTDDADGHGSHVAGIIGASGKQVCGIAPDAKLMIIKVAVKTSEWKIENIIKGIDYAIQHNADIISISGEFPENHPEIEALKETVKKAIQKGISIVASAGNNYNSFPVESYPAAFDECISVGSIKKDGTRADSSSHSEKLDLVAPGDEILSTWINNDYHVESGTSMATPLVASVAAILKAYAKKNLNKEITPSALHVIFTKSADDAGDHGFDTSYGFGIINPLKALNMLIA